MTKFIVETRWNNLTDVKLSKLYYMSNANTINFKSLLCRYARFAYSQGLVRFCVSFCATIVCTSYNVAKIKNVKNDICRFCHLPLNGVLEKIALRNLDLLFFLKVKIKNVYISETVRASLKICGRHLNILTFAIEFVKIALLELDLLFGGQQSKIVTCLKR